MFFFPERKEVIITTSELSEERNCEQTKIMVRIMHGLVALYLHMLRINTCNICERLQTFNYFCFERKTFLMQ